MEQTPGCGGSLLCDKVPVSGQMRTEMRVYRDSVTVVVFFRFVFVWVGSRTPQQMVEIQTTLIGR